MSTQASPPSGVVVLASYYPVTQTIDRLESLLKEKGVMIFARIDFSGDAGRAGLHMRPEQMLIFGNPKGGTPLMLAAQSAAIDLPLKILVAEDSQGKVWISYNSPHYLKERHGLPVNLVPNIAVVQALAAAAAE